MAEAGARRARGAFARGVATLASGTAVGQLAVIAAAPALTRLYSPEVIGQAGLALNFVGLIAMIAGLRYEAAIVSAPSEESADHLLAAALIALIPMTALACFALGALVDAGWLGFDLLPSWIAWAAGPMLAATALVGIARFTLVRSSAYDAVSRLLVGQGVGRAIAPLLLAPFGLAGLIAGETVGRLVGLRAAYRESLARLRRVRLKRTFEEMRSSWRYPAIFLPSSLVDAAATLAPLPIVAALYGPTAAGQFALVQRLLAAPIGLVAASVADVFHREAVDRPDLRRFVLSTSGRLFTLAAGPVAVLGALGPLVFGWVFGEEWRLGGWLLLALVPYALGAIAVSPVTRVVLVVGRQEIKLVYDALALALAVGGLCGAHAAGMPLVGSVAVYSGLQAIAFALYLALLARVAGGVRSAG